MRAASNKNGTPTPVNYGRGCSSGTPQLTGRVGETEVSG